MKVEIDIQDATINRMIQSTLERQATLDHYGKPTGPLAESIKAIADDQIQSVLVGMDLKEMVQQRIHLSLIPTLETIIDQQIKAAAKKAVKAEMDKKQETQP
jgi:hypothetical protein